MTFFEFTMLTSKTNNIAVPFTFIFFCKHCSMFYNVSEDSFRFYTYTLFKIFQGQFIFLNMVFGYYLR